MNSTPGLFSFVASPDPDALTAARNGMASAASDLIAAISPMLNFEQQDYIANALRNGWMLTSEQAIDGVGRTSTAICLVSPSGLDRVELSAISTPDRPAP